LTPPVDGGANVLGSRRQPGLAGTGEPVSVFRASTRPNEPMRRGDPVGQAPHGEVTSDVPTPHVATTNAEIVQPTVRDRIRTAGLKHLPPIFIRDVSEAGFSTSYLNSLRGTDYLLRTDDVYSREGVNRSLRATPTYTGFWDRRVTDVNEHRERRAIDSINKADPRIDRGATIQVFVTDQPGVAQLDELALRVQALADRDDLSREELTEEFTSLQTSIAEIIGPPPLQEAIEERTEAVLDEVLPRYRAGEPVTEVVGRSALWERLGTTADEWPEHMRKYNLHLHEQGFRTRGVKLGEGATTDRYIWIEQIPDAEDTLVVMGEVVRFRDREMPLDPSNDFALRIVAKKAMRKERVDTMLTNPADGDGAEVIAGLNQDFRLLTGKYENVIALGGNEDVGYFYHPKGVHIEVKPMFIPVSTEQLNAVDVFLSGGTVDEVRAAELRGSVGGVQQSTLSDYRVFTGLQEFISKLTNRNNAGIIRQDEAEVYERVTAELERSGCDMVEYLQEVATRLGLDSSVVKPEMVQKQIVQVAHSRELTQVRP
jgi:hypothetical protein